MDNITIEPLCIVCLQPLTDGEAVRKPYYHDSCLSCHYCHKPVGLQIAEKQIDQEEKTNPNRDYPAIIYHQPCEDAAIKLKFDARPLTITQGDLNYVNKHLAMLGFNFDGSTMECLLNSEISVDANNQSGDLAVVAFMQSVCELDITQRFLLAKRMQSVATMISIMNHRDPRMRDVQLEITARDRKKFEETQKLRENSGKAQQAEAEKRHARAVRKTEIEVSTQESQERRTQRDAERTDPMLKMRRKAIESMMASNPLLSREACEKILGSAGVA